jgi:hypothetical protein
LAAAIHHQQLEMTAVRSIRASIETPPRTVGILSKSITLFDLLTYLVPACVLGIGASIVRRPEELPLALCSMADVEHTMSIEVVGAISSPNGPVVPQRAEASPPESILRLVFACEVFCVAAAVVFTIAFFQIPNFSAQFVHNPLAAFVTSVDLVIDFIGSFF